MRRTNYCTPSQPKAGVAVQSGILGFLFLPHLRDVPACSAHRSCSGFWKEQVSLRSSQGSILFFLSSAPPCWIAPLPSEHALQPPLQALRIAYQLVATQSGAHLGKGEKGIRNHCLGATAWKKEEVKPHQAMEQVEGLSANVRVRQRCLCPNGWRRSRNPHRAYQL